MWNKIFTEKKPQITARERLGGFNGNVTPCIIHAGLRRPAKTTSFFNLASVREGELLFQGRWRRPLDLDQGCLTPFRRRHRCPTDGASAPAGEATALATAQRTHPRDDNRPRSLLTDRRQMERVRSGGNLGIDERRRRKPERANCAPRKGADAKAGGRACHNRRARFSLLGPAWETNIGSTILLTRPLNQRDGSLQGPPTASSVPSAVLYRRRRGEGTKDGTG